MEDDLNFCEIKDNLNFLLAEEDLNIVQDNLGIWISVSNLILTQIDEIWKLDDLNSFENWRQHKFL